MLCIPVTGSQTDIAARVSPWYPEATVSRRVRPGRPVPRAYCSAILMATSTETEPESARKTASSPGGAISTSSSASSTAAGCVMPPNITCAMASSCVRTASSRVGWRCPWMAAHHDDMPSMTCRPSASVSVVPAAATTGTGGTGDGIGA